MPKLLLKADLNMILTRFEGACWAHWEASDVIFLISSLNTQVCSCGREVKASDSKSDSLWERRFESCQLRQLFTWSKNEWNQVFIDTAKCLMIFIPVWNQFESIVESEVLGDVEEPTPGDTADSLHCET